MFQTIILAGNLGSDPELRYTPSGQAVCKLSVATNRQWSNDKGEAQKETCWFRVSVWGKQAEACNTYLVKGRPVLVEGRLAPDASGNPKIWNGNDGTPHASYEVTAQVVRFLPSAKDTASVSPAVASETEDDDGW